MTKQEEILLLVPKGYKQIIDNQTCDNTTVARINPDGSIDYLRCVPNAN